MSTRHLFSRSSIRAFETKTGVTIDLDEKQTNALATAGGTELRLDQFDTLIKLLHPTFQAQTALIERGPWDACATSITLFVVNEATWAIMKKKETEKDRMLPMLTVPWFRSDSSEATKEKGQGPRRHELNPPTIRFDSSHQAIVVEGECGDFCGILDARLARRKHELRPMLLPGPIGSRSLVPLYERESCRLTVDITGRNDVNPYPNPSTTFDYTYSESPKVFYEHGLGLRTAGTQIRLKTGRSKEYNLRGDVTLLIGIPHKDSVGEENAISAHLWLRVLGLVLAGGMQL